MTTAVRSSPGTYLVPPKKLSVSRYVTLLGFAREREMRSERGELFK